MPQVLPLSLYLHPALTSLPTWPLWVCLVPPPAPIINKLVYFTFSFGLLLNPGSPSDTPELYLTNVSFKNSQHCVHLYTKESLALNNVVILSTISASTYFCAQAHILNPGLVPP